MRATVSGYPMVCFRRPNIFKDELVTSKVGKWGDGRKGTRKCGKGRCKICTLVEEGNEFDDGKGIENVKYIMTLIVIPRVLFIL